MGYEQSPLPSASLLDSPWFSPPEYVLFSLTANAVNLFGGIIYWWDSPVLIHFFFKSDAVIHCIFHCLEKMTSQPAAVQLLNCDVLPGGLAVPLIYDIGDHFLSTFFPLQTQLLSIQNVESSWLGCWQVFESYGPQTLRAF